MADNIIDSLSIEIGSDVGNAQKSIRKLKSELQELRDAFNQASGMSGDIGAKLKELASGINEITTIDADKLKSATSAIRGFAKLDLSAINSNLGAVSSQTGDNLCRLADAIYAFSTIPDVGNSIKALRQMATADFTGFANSVSAVNEDITDKLAAIADGVNLFSMQIDRGAVTGALSTIKKLREFDFQGLSMNVDNLDPAIATKARQFMDAFSGIAGSAAVGDTLESMQNLFSVDFSGFLQFISKVSTEMPKFSEGLQTFARACTSQEFQAAVANLQKLAGVDLSGLAMASSNKKIVPDISGQLAVEKSETEKEVGLITGILGKLKASGSTLASDFASMGTGFASFIGFVSSGFTRLWKNLQKVNERMTRFIRSLGRIAMYRTVRFILSQIARGFKEGADNLYHYSKAIDGQFAKSMDMMATSLLYFRNSVAAAAAPIINHLAPAIDILVDRIVEALNFLNELSAKLTGATTWTKALKYPKEYAESTKEASKAMKDFTMGFDELNVISDSGSSSMANGLDYSKMFKEMKVDIDFEPWADAFREAIENEYFNEAGSILGEMLRQAFEDTDFSGTGETLGEKINNAVSFANGFLDQKPFDELGRGIGNFLNSSMLEIDWTDVASMFNGGLNGILTSVSTFLETFDTYEVGKKLGEGLSGFDLGETLSNAGTTIKTFLDDVLDGVNGFLEGADWKKLGGDLFKGLSDFIFGNDWAETGGKVVTVLGNIATSATELLGGFSGEIVLNLFDDEAVSNWESGAEDITGAIDKVKGKINEIKTDIEEQGWGNYWEGIGGKIYDAFHKGSDGADDFEESLNDNELETVHWWDVVKGTFTEFGDNWKTTVNDVTSKLASLSVTFTSKMSSIKSTVTNKVDEIKKSWETKMGDIKTNVSNKLNDIGTKFSNKFKEITKTTDTDLAELAVKFTEFNGLDSFKDNWISGMNEVKDAVTKMKDSVSDTFGQIPDAIKSSANNIFYYIEQIVNGMISGFNQFSSNMASFGFNIPDWVPGIGGNSFTFTVPQIPNVQLGRFENGGYPVSGDLFYANENGTPEMVGRIGQRTAVANNDQIVAAVADGVASVLEAYMPQLISTIKSSGNTVVELDGRAISRTVQKNMRESGATIFGGGVANATY